MKSSYKAKSIRTIAYASMLVLSAFSIQPSLAAAQEVKGTFSLPHEVHWKNQVVSAGEYTFLLDGSGATQTLVLRGLKEAGSTAILLIDGVRMPKPKEISQLVLVSRNGQSFVSSMALPEFDVVLEFKVPAETEATQMSANSLAKASSDR